MYHILSPHSKPGKRRTSQKGTFNWMLNYTPKNLSENHSSRLLQFRYGNLTFRHTFTPNKHETGPSLIAVETRREGGIILLVSPKF